MSARRLLLLAVLLPLTLGATRCTKREVPGVCPVVADVQLVNRDVYVPLPDGVTRPVVDPDPGKTDASTTYGRAVKRADTRDALLATCNAQLREAAQLQGRIVGDE
jgi:hypothetical protein